MVLGFLKPKFLQREAGMNTLNNNSTKKMEPSKSGLEPLLVGAQDLAEMLGISEATFWRWDAAGELGPPGIKKWGRRLWPLAEVKAWVSSGMPSRETWLAMKRSEGTLLT